MIKGSALARVCAEQLVWALGLRRHEKETDHPRQQMCWLRMKVCSPPWHTPPPRDHSLSPDFLPSLRILGDFWKVSQSSWETPVSWRVLFYCTVCVVLPAADPRCLLFDLYCLAFSSCAPPPQTICLLPLFSLSSIHVEFPASDVSFWASAWCQWLNNPCKWCTHAVNVASWNWPLTFR